MAMRQFEVPTDERYFEDYRPGAVYEFGDVTMDEARIIEFAREFDPQPIHVDPDAAARGMYGGIIASGFHTTAVMMRLLADNYLSRVAIWAAPASTSCAGCSRCAPVTRFDSGSPSWTPGVRRPNPTVASCAPGPR